MLLVLSPAKSLDFAPAASDLPLSTPQLKSDIAELARTTRKLRRGELKQLMAISDNLAELNHARFQAFDPACDDGLQAVIAFNGDVYSGLDARSLDKAALNWAQDHLRILSGLYGVLRPLDALQAYRLEMGTRLKTRRGASLYDFWGDRISQTLNAAGGGHADPTLVNLASQEYFAAVRTDALKLPLIACHFRETREGEPGRVISFYAKKARGLMARFAILGRVDRPEGLKDFTTAGYAYQPALSTPIDWVFTRPQPQT
jgi:cytoplasmic iron level regulating protein YaaA (DUF328/UPF0246 family)